MSRQRFVLLLLAALVVIVCGVYFAVQRERPETSPGMMLLPALADTAANAVSSVTLRKGNAAPAVTLHKANERWTVAERADYPADVGKIRKLLQSLRDAKIVEEKTSDPARFAEIGVADPSSVGAAGAEVAVAAATMKLAVIIGKPAGEGTFVRRAGENRTYSVEPPISVDTAAKDWIDPSLLDVTIALIQSVDVKPADGPSYRVLRQAATDATYSLEGVPPGRKPVDAHALAPGETTFTGLRAEDVAAASDIDFGHAAHAAVNLSDGNVISLTGTVVANKHWLELSASKDAALTDKTKGRAFEIASYRYDAIFKPLEQLLVPKEPPAPPPGKITPSQTGKPALQSAKPAPAATP